jgi:hypothetical protein
VTERKPRFTRTLTRRRLGALLASVPVMATLPWIGGCSGSSLARHAGPVSDHFDGERFFNPGGAGPRGFMDLARWRMGGNSEDWPETYPSPFPPDRPPPRMEGAALRVSFVGHATFLIQGAGLNILTDPVWSERASPFPFIGPKRANPPGIAFDDLPSIDAVLVSHGHYDHLDVETLARLWHRDRPRIVAPLGNDATIRGHDAAIEVTTADWHGTVPLGKGVEAVLEPVHHWTARGLWARNCALWCGFIPGIVDKHVEPPELPVHLTDRVLHLGAVRDVHGHRQDALVRMRGAQALGCFLQRCGVEVQQRHILACRGQGPAMPKPKPRAPPVTAAMSAWSMVRPPARGRRTQRVHAPRCRRRCIGSGRPWRPQSAAPWRGPGDAR